MDQPQCGSHSRPRSWFRGHRLAVAGVNRSAGRLAKSGHNDVGRGPVVRSRTEVPERQLSMAIEHEIAAHLRQVQLLGMPDLSAHGETYVAPDRPRWSNGPRPSPSEPEASVAPAIRVGKPQVGMSQMFGEALEMARTSKRDDSDPSVELRYLPVELPQLREMLLAIESTEVAKQDQNGRPPQQPARVEELSVKGLEVEVKVDLHRRRS